MDLSVAERIARASTHLRDIHNATGILKSSLRKDNAPIMHREQFVVCGL